jgi:MYXO-CTERM domain-containing protein
MTRLLGSVLALACACTEEPLTQIVVKVESDLAIPDRIDEVRVVVIGLGPAHQESGATLRASSDLPRTVTLVHDGGSLGPIDVIARAFAAETMVVERRARVFFDADRTRLLRLRLLGECAGVACGEAETCREGGVCATSATALEPWPPEAPADGGWPDASLPVDGGWPEASPPADGGAHGSDAGTDSGSIDAGAPDACARAELCNGEDDDCDGEIDEDAADRTEFYADSDSDGFGGESLGLQCTAPDGAVQTSTDCDDADAAVNPDADELCNAIDDDCDLQIDENATDATDWWVDADGDGYGSTRGAGCAPDGSVGRAGDCDDADPTANPDGVEIPGDGIDQDCDGHDTQIGTDREHRPPLAIDAMGCGCQSSSGGGAWLAVLAALVIRRRYK